MCIDQYEKLCDEQAARIAELERENAALREQLATADALLRSVYLQAGNGAPPSRRHALTPQVRDDMRDFIYKSLATEAESEHDD